MVGFLELQSVSQLNVTGLEMHQLFMGTLSPSCIKQICMILHSIDGLILQGVCLSVIVFLLIVDAQKTVFILLKWLNHANIGCVSARHYINLFVLYEEYIIYFSPFTV